MTNKEAKMLLYKFLMEHGMATKYYYNCIYHCPNLSAERIRVCKPLYGKDKLRKIMDMHFDEHFSRFNTFEGFFNYASHSFDWNKTQEGYEFWDKLYYKWRDKYHKRFKEMITS
jgi:hypothetical protein